MERWTVASTKPLRALLLRMLPNKRLQLAARAGRGWM
jgi:hypothetical protein